MSLKLIDPENDPHPPSDLIPPIRSLLALTGESAESYARLITCLKPRTNGSSPQVPLSAPEALRPVLDRGGLGDVSTLGRRVDKEGSIWCQPDVVGALLEASDVLGFESPRLGFEVVKIAMSAAPKYFDIELLVRALATCAARALALGKLDNADTIFQGAMSQFEDLEPALVATLCRRYSYLLTRRFEYRGAYLAAATALRANPFPGRHEHGRIHLAFAYSYAAERRYDYAVRSYESAAPLLDPLRGFADCFQAALNMILLLATDREQLPAALELLSELEAISPFDSGTVPDLYLKWARARLLIRSERPAEALPFAEIVHERFRDALPQAWLASGLDLAATYHHCDRDEELSARARSLSAALTGESPLPDLYPESYVVNRFCERLGEGDLAGAMALCSNPDLLQCAVAT